MNEYVCWFEGIKYCSSQFVTGYLQRLLVLASLAGNCLDHYYCIFFITSASLPTQFSSKQTQTWLRLLLLSRTNENKIQICWVCVNWATATSATSNKRPEPKPVGSWHLNVLRFSRGVQRESLRRRRCCRLDQSTIRARASAAYT